MKSRVEDVSGGRLGVAGRRVEVARAASNAGEPPADAPRRTFRMQNTSDFGIVRSQIELGAPSRKCTTCPGIGQLFGHDVDYATNGIGPIEHARRSANHLDPLGDPCVDRWTILIAPRVVFESQAVVEYQDARPSETTNDWLTDLLAGTQRSDTCQLVEGMRERDFMLSA